MQKNTKIYLSFILGTEAAGGIIGWLIKDGVNIYKTLPKPPLTPPPLVFPIAWTTLYALMGFGAARIYALTSEKKRKNDLLLYFSQLAFNLLWSIIFFNLQAFGFSFFWLLTLWVLIWWMYFSWKQTDKLAANLQIPYLLWTTFAAYLNYGTWMLNM